MSVDEIVAALSESFPAFGGKSKLVAGNPLSYFLKDKPPVFAAGVDIKAVVNFVLERSAIGKN